MNQIYSKLYDIVEEELSNVERQLPCSKTVYMMMTEQEPGVCNELAMQKLENEEFFQMAFISLLRRLPDEDSKRIWQYNIEKKDLVSFRTVLLDTLASSGEAISKGTRVINNVVVPVKQREIVLLNDIITDFVGDRKKREERQRIFDRVYKCYVKMPLPIRHVVRKVLGKD